MINCIRRVLMVSLLSSALIQGCEMFGSRIVSQYDLDELQNEKVSKSFVPEVFIPNKVDVLVSGVESEGVFVEKGVEVEVQIDGKYEVFDILKMVLGQFGYTVVSVSIGEVMVFIDGKYTELELIDLSKGVCEALGFTFKIDGRICTVVKVDSKGSLVDSIVIYRPRFIEFKKEILDEMRVGNDLRILSYKNILVVIGVKLSVLRLVEAIKAMDVDLLSGRYVKFVSCSDADKVIVGLSGMYELEGVKVLKVTDSLVVIVSTSREYLEYVCRMVKTLSVYSTSSVVYVYKSRYRSVASLKAYIDVIDRVEMVVDNELSAIFFKCSYEKFLMIKRSLVSFDVLPKQVLMRLYMVDVRSSQDMGVGVDWSLVSKGFNINQTAFGSVLSGGISGVYQMGDVKVFFNMLEKLLDARVISKPSVYVKSGQSAEIKFTRSVPVLVTKGSGQSLGVGAGIIQQVDYKDVGIIFRVTPVCVGGNILVDIYVENSSLQKETGVENNPMFLKDSVSSSFTVADGSFCVLGGLKYTNNEWFDNGVFFLRGIKFMGYLFGGLKRFNEKREMLVCLFPKVVRNEYESDRLSEVLLDGVKLNFN